MRRLTVLTVTLLIIPAMAWAHVGVRPRESKAGAEETYTIRVPTEGTVATTHVELEIPAGVTVLEVLLQDGATFEVAKQADRITSITWKKEIAPNASAEFVFRARNPASGDISWKAHQHFVDGTTADWIGGAGDKRPAAVTRLTAAAVERESNSDSERTAVEAPFKGHSAVFNSKDLDSRSSFNRSDVMTGSQPASTSSEYSLVVMSWRSASCDARHPRPRRT